MVGDRTINRGSEAMQIRSLIALSSVIIKLIPNMASWIDWMQASKHALIATCGAISAPHALPSLPALKVCFQL